MKDIAEELVATIRECVHIALAFCVILAALPVMVLLVIVALMIDVFTPRRPTP